MYSDTLATESPLMKTTLPSQQTEDKTAQFSFKKESPMPTIPTIPSINSFTFRNKETPDASVPFPSHEQTSLDEKDLEDDTEQQEELDLAEFNGETTQQQHQVQLFINPEVTSPTSSMMSPQIYEGSEDYLSYFEAKLYLKRNIAFFSLLSVASLALILGISEIVSFQHVFNAFYVYLGYCFFDNKKRAGFPRREAWRCREDYLGMMDNFINILFLVLINLRVFGLMKFEIMFFTPYLFSSVVYAFFSKASIHTRFVRASFRSLMTVQVIFITLQFSTDIDWDWIFVFIPSWIYLFAVAAFLIAICLATFESCRGVDQDFNPQPKGLLWHFCYYGLGEIALLFMIGANQAFCRNGSWTVLKIAGYLCFLINSFLVYFTAKHFRLILRHIQDFWLSDGTLIEPIPDLNRTGPGEPANLKFEKKESYFLKLSSTYYRHLDNRTGKKDLESRQNPPSMDDLDKVNEQSTAGTADSNEDEDLCYLCCEKKCDAIMMNCGHGGVCYDCVIPLIKKKSQCMQCRSLVSEVYKFDVNASDAHVIKTTEIAKVVKKY